MATILRLSLVTLMGLSWQLWLISCSSSQEQGSGQEEISSQDQANPIAEGEAEAQNEGDQSGNETQGNLTNNAEVEEQENNASFGNSEKDANQSNELISENGVGGENIETLDLGDEGGNFDLNADLEANISDEGQSTDLLANTAPEQTQNNTPTVANQANAAMTANASSSNFTAADALQSLSGTNIAPINQASTPAPTEESAPMPPPEADVLPVSATLWWVGYDYRKNSFEVKIQLLTKGKPEIQLFKELNQSKQPELVVRFLSTLLRKKINRDLNASEFLSPVSFIRMRENTSDSSVDVVLTLRELVQPTMTVNEGNVLMTFKIPENYKADRIANKSSTENAELLSSEQNLAKEKIDKFAKKEKKPYVADPAKNAFGESAATTVGYNNIKALPTLDHKGLPQDFDRLRVSALPAKPKVDAEILVISRDGVVYWESPKFKPKAEEKKTEPSTPQGAHRMLAPTSQDYAVKEFSVFGVAQDDLSNPSPQAAFGAEFANPAMETPPGSTISEQNVTFELSTTEALLDPTTQAEIVGQDNETPAEKFSGKPVVLEFYQTPLSQVLKAFSEQIATNFIYPPALGTTPVSIRLRNVPWDAALNAILETYRLGMTKVSANVIRIDRIEDMSRFLILKDEATKAKILTEPTKLLVVRLSNANANELKGSLDTFMAAEKTIDKRIKISSDTRTNSLFVEAPPSTLGRVRALIDRLDLRTPQIEIISRLVEVGRSVGNFLGISWGSKTSYDARSGLGFGTLNFPQGLASNFNVDPGVNETASAGSAAINIGSINDVIDLNLRLKMEESKGTTEILQSSKVVVVDGKNADITSGISGVIPRTAGTGTVVVAGGEGGGGSSGYDKIDFNLSLKVTPKVTNDGRVDMTIALSSSVPSASVVPGTTANSSSRQANTQMIVRSGETAVLGGIYDTKKIRTTTGIPFLSSLPIIGALFRSDSYTEQQTELLMMITPTIKNGESAGAADTVAEDNSNFDSDISLDDSDSQQANSQEESSEEGARTAEVQENSENQSQQAAEQENNGQAANQGNETQSNNAAQNGNANQNANANNGHNSGEGNVAPLENASGQNAIQAQSINDQAVQGNPASFEENAGGGNLQALPQSNQANSQTLGNGSQGQSNNATNL